MINELIFTIVLVSVIAIFFITKYIISIINMKDMLKKMGMMSDQMQKMNFALQISDKKTSILKMVDKYIMDSVTYELKQLKYTNTGQYYGTSHLDSLTTDIFDRFDRHISKNFIDIVHMVIDSESWNDYLVRRIYLITLETVTELNKRSIGNGGEIKPGDNIDQVDG